MEWNLRRAPSSRDKTENTQTDTHKQERRHRENESSGEPMQSRKEWNDFFFLILFCFFDLSFSVGTTSVMTNLNIISYLIVITIIIGN